MIIERIKGTTQDNVEVLDSIKMTIDEEATVFLLQSISESLYSNPERAILQELGSNAFDSHIRAGQTRPFEVTLPSSLNPVLIIRDWGVGMSKADVRSVFSKVGGSDKRETNAERGGLGLGSKSPLAITPSYSLITVKDGEKHTIAVIRDEDGIPDFKFVGYEKTDEPSGVTIAVPVKDIAAMNKAADNLYITYPQGSVLINGQLPKYSLHNPDQFQRIGTFGWFALEEGAVESFKEASGEILGVRYPLKPELDGGIVTNLSCANRVFLSLPNGDVKVETNREGIRSVSQSREHVTRIAQAWTEEFRAQAAKRLEESDRFGAYTYHRLLPKFLQEELPTWNGETIPTGDIPIFPVQRVEKTDVNGEPTGTFIRISEADARFVPPPFTATVKPSLTRARCTSSVLAKNGEKHPAPESRDVLTVVYVLPDSAPSTVSAAERDIRDYERWLGRAGMDCGAGETRYITTAAAEEFTPWFRELAQFVPIENIAEAAFEERRAARRDSAARRQRGEYVRRNQREKRDYNSLLGTKSSSSERARLNTESVTNLELDEHVHGRLVDVPEDATEVQRAMAQRVDGGGKVAYVIPNADERSRSIGRVFAQATDRAAHPGVKTIELAASLMTMLTMEGYKVVALRASQSVSSLLEDVPSARPVIEVVDEVLRDLAERFIAQEDSLALWSEEASREVMARLEGRIEELNDPLFAEGGARPSREVTHFLGLLRRGVRSRYNRSDRDAYTGAVHSNLTVLGFDADLSERLKACHDYITELTLLRRYPLLKAAKHSSLAIDHAILYANMVHAAANSVMVEE